MTCSAGRIVGIAGLGALALAASGAAAQPQPGAGAAAQPRLAALAGAVPRNGAVHREVFAAAQPQLGTPARAVPHNGAVHREVFAAAQPRSGAPAGAVPRTGAGHPQGSAAAPPPAAADAATTRAALDRYCVACHNARTLTAGLALDGVDPAHVADDAAVWEKVLRKLRTRMMPPSPRPRPDAATYASLVTYLETALDRAAEADPDPGRPAVQRLNRAEYANAVRDLLALDIDAQTLLPADDSGYGFDNIGDVLSVSPGLLERYLLAAAKISRQAVGDPTLRPTTAAYRTSPLLAQDGRASEDLPFGSRGGLAVRHHFPLDAEYVVRVALRGRARDGHALEVRLDRERVQRFDLGDRAPLEVRVPVAAGTRLLGVSFVEALERSLPRDGRPPPPPITSFAFTLYPNDPSVERVEVVGPYAGRTPADDTPSRRAIFTCRPDTPDDEAACAGRIVSSLARRAYRRPVTAADTAPLLAAWEAGRREGAGFDDGVRWTIEALLVSPKFLFRVEQTPAEAAPGAPYRIHDLDLASRLSFFLWSSIPDDELVDLAARGRLREPGVLEQQVRRMLGDARARALVENFAGQWLYLRNLRSIAPDATRFPEFDDNLRDALRQETELFVGSQIREDRGVLDLLGADYTFVNERLARHYGMPDVYGSHFRRVSYRDDRRAGLLGHGSLLTVTSYPHRTSPVLRGKWLLENLLGAPPPPPPPDIPELDEPGGRAAPATMRERMAQHRASPACATCHAKIDPLGFALENFDAVGRWRAREDGAGTSIDASGALPDGAPFDGPATFRDALLREPWATELATTVTEKLLTYAIGRGLEYYDAPAVRRILRDAEPGGYRWSSLMLGIVESVPFQMQRAPDTGDARAQ